MCFMNDICITVHTITKSKRSIRKDGNHGTYNKGFNLTTTD